VSLFWGLLMRLAATLAAFVALAAALGLSAGPAGPPPKNGPPGQTAPTRPQAAKSAPLAGADILQTQQQQASRRRAIPCRPLTQNPGVSPVLAIDWPKKPETLAGAKAVVFFFDGAEKHQVLKEDRIAKVQKLMDDKVGLVQLHQTADYPKDFGDKARGWAGGA